MPRLPAFALTATLAFTALALAQDAATIVVDPAIATMTNEQLVDARQTAMMQNGRTMRSAGGLSGADAVAAATSVLQNFTNLAHMFPDGSIVGDSEALPVIFEQREAFDGIFAKATAAASQMLDAAVAGDATAYRTAVGAVGETCNACHDQFRQERG